MPRVLRVEVVHVLQELEELFRRAPTPPRTCRAHSINQKARPGLCGGRPETERQHIRHSNGA